MQNACIHLTGCIHLTIHWLSTGEMDARILHRPHTSVLAPERVSRLAEGHPSGLGLYTLGGALAYRQRGETRAISPPSSPRRQSGKD